MNRELPLKAGIVLKQNEEGEGGVRGACGVISRVFLPPRQWDPGLPQRLAVNSLSRGDTLVRLPPSWQEQVLEMQNIA